MAMEIPVDLIKQVQTSLRKEAKVPDYDPDDPSLPNLLSFGDSIAELDPSPADLRCSHCKGRLLRGPQSSLCVFCGRRPRGDGDPTPPPIKFLSAVGYRWFLHSLGLDGSEFVRPTTEAAKSNGVRNAPPMEVQLSDLLDLEVQWHDETELYSAYEIFNKQKGLASLVGVDVDLYFPEGNSDPVPAKSEGQFPSKLDGNVTESTLSRDPEKLSALENVQTGGWADFQFSEFKTPHDESRGLDHFVGSFTDFSSTTDEGPAPLGHSLESPSNNWFEDDKQHKSGISETFSAIKVENDDDSFDTWNDFESSKFVEDASGGSLNPTDTNIRFVEGKSRISLSDFGERLQSQVSDSQREKSVSSEQCVGSSFDLSAQMDEIFGYGKSSFHEKGKDDLWSNRSEKFGSAAGSKNGETEGNTGVSSSGKPDGTSIIDKDHPFDVWNDSRSSISPSDALKNSSQEISCTKYKGEESGDPFSGWQAERQSVKSEIHHGTSEPHELTSQVSSVDLSTQMDAIFRPILKGKNTADSLSGSSNNWFQNEQWNDLSSRVTPQASQYDMSIDVKDSGKIGKEQNISSTDWLANDLWQTRGSNDSDRKTPVEDDDSTEAWNDFESSNVAGAASMNPLKQDGNNLSFSELSFASEHHGYEVKDVKAVEKADKFLVDFDWMQDDQQKIGSKEQPDHISVGVNDDMSDEWNEFASSTNAQDTFISYSKQGVDNVNHSLTISDMNFFSMDINPQKDDADSFSQQGLFSGTFGNQHVLSEGRSMSNRNDGAPQCSGNTEVAKDDLEALMSQMHDLSFMLESSLAVPSKSKQDGT